jgi:enoyl-CoA hydratase/carnithine racemase
MTEYVTLSVQGAVGVIRLDRPPVNAINRRMHGELLDVATQVQGNRDIRAVVLHGGERAFAAGADIREMSGLGPLEIAAFGHSLTTAVDAVARLRVPVIASVVGFALGGGLELALAADFRIVAEDARLGLPEITLGVMPGAGGTQRLPRLIGVTAAKQLIFTGQPVTGVRAVELGLATAAEPAGQVLIRAMELAGRLATGPTAALAAAKSAIDNGLDVDLASGLRWEADGFAALFATDDQRTGMASFLADGPGQATFTGR